MRQRTHILAATLALALATMACGFGLNPPVTNFKIGSISTVDIQIPMSAEPSAAADLNLEFVAGELKLAPGADKYLASGTATFNVAEFAPKVEGSGSSYTVCQPNLELEGIPNFQKDIKNEWDLKLAATPLHLDIKAGAYTGNFELGGLSLEQLTVSEGGSQVTAAFSEPNRVKMSTFRYSTGASKVELSGLANANFDQMSFTAGAGDYTLSFDGELKRDATVTIDSGMGTVKLIVPDGADAQVTFDSGMSKVNVEGPWSQDGNVYKLSGSGPAIIITVKMGAGALNLVTK